MQKYNPQGGLLLIEYPLIRISTWDSNYEFKKYFDEQIIFVNKLLENHKKQLIIRLHGNSKYMNWNEVGRWKEVDVNLKVEYEGGDISLLVNASRLVVHSYDSSGILETLVQNIPTLAFWRNGKS